MEIAGNIIIYAGIIFMLIGVIGILKYKNFYARILITTKIDTVGVFTIIVGIIVKHGISFFSLKLLLLLVLIMIINPLITHIIAHCAYSSGLEIKEDSQ
jgi:multicomponent Na+:H+ antiporter subunit G